MHTETTEFNGTPALRLTHEGATALVALHGAQLLSWIPAGPGEARSRERLFLSERAKYAEGSAIRGGVPVIFPQFGERGILPKHGFARTLAWSFAGTEDGAATFELRNDARTAHWPHAFIARLRVRLEATQLELTLEIENTAPHAFDFTAALHTYLRVDELAQVAVQGLQGCDYEDSANGGTLHREIDYEIGFEGNVLDDGLDRIYNDVVAPVTLVDGTHELRVEQEGFPDCVVWNPGEHLAARIHDLAPGDWRHFVCIEAGQVLQPEVLAPGESWSGSQRLGG